MATSKAQIRATNKYAKTHYKRIPLNLNLDYFNQMKAFLDSEGIPVNTYIKEAIGEKLDRDGFVYTPEIDGEPLPDKAGS